jgi:hypothetical protein
MKTVYLGGHGAWTIKDGYAEVPKGCTISFYTEFSKNMFTSDMKAIIGGTFNGSVKQKIEQYKTCPNYTLSPDSVSYAECRTLLLARNDANLSLVMFPSGPDWTLKSIFEWASKGRIAADFIWCACRFTGLKDEGGKAIGVNGAQGTWGDRDNLGNLLPPGGNPNPDLFFFNATTKIVKNL